MLNAVNKLKHKTVRLTYHKYRKASIIKILINARAEQNKYVTNDFIEIVNDQTKKKCLYIFTD